MVEGVCFTASRPQEMDDFLAAGDQELGDETPVAPLPGGLGAHEARGRLGKLTREGVLPLRGAHAGGVAPEGRDPEAAELLLTRLAAEASAELDRVPIHDPGLGESVLEGPLVELRVPARAGEAADVDESPDAFLLQGADELLEWSDAVTDREDVHRIAAPMVGRGGRWQAA